MCYGFPFILAFCKKKSLRSVLLLTSPFWFHPATFGFLPRLPGSTVCWRQQITLSTKWMLLVFCYFINCLYQLFSFDQAVLQSILLFRGSSDNRFDAVYCMAGRFLLFHTPTPRQLLASACIVNSFYLCCHSKM